MQIIFRKGHAVTPKVTLKKQRSNIPHLQQVYIPGTKGFCHFLALRQTKLELIFFFFTMVVAMPDYNVSVYKFYKQVTLLYTVTGNLYRKVRLQRVIFV